MAVGPPLWGLGFTQDSKPHTPDKATVFSTMPIHGPIMDVSELYIESNRTFAILIALRSLDITKSMFIRDIDKLLWTRFEPLLQGLQSNFEPTH